jgi:transposase
VFPEQFDGVFQRLNEIEASMFADASEDDDQWPSFTVGGLINDGLWGFLYPLLPTPHHKGERDAVRQRAVAAAVVYAVTTETPWENIPEVFGVGPSTARRRFLSWTDADLWRKLRMAAVATPHAGWAREVADAATTRAGNRAHGHDTPTDTRPTDPATDGATGGTDPHAGPTAPRYLEPRAAE